MSSPSVDVVAKTWNFFAEIGEKFRTLKLRQAQPSVTNIFEQFPIHIRESIYNFLAPADILTLRKVDRWFKDEVDSVRGVFGEWKACDPKNQRKRIQKIGIRSLSVQVETKIFDIIHPSESINLKFPILLHSLKILERIPRANFQYFMKNCHQLKRLELNLLKDDPAFLAKSKFRCNFPKTLQEFTLIMPFKDARVKTAKSDRSLKRFINQLNLILTQCSSQQCPSIKTFCLEIKEILPSHNHKEAVEFHKAALSFIKDHRRTLKAIDLKLWSPHPKKVDDDFMDFGFGSPLTEDWLQELDLKEFKYRSHCILDHWSSVILASKRLEIVDISVKYWSITEARTLETRFNSLTLGDEISRRCMGTLRQISVKHICLKDRGLTRKFPEDFKWTEIYPRRTRVSFQTEV